MEKGRNTNSIDAELAPVEVQNSESETLPNDLHRDFKRRQVSMFSLACAIGTGLIIGSGTGLARGGPGFLLISYILIGITVFFVMTALGEMATFLPMKKGFGGYATRMVDPAFGFATGWNYFFKYAINIPTNLTAAGLIITFWRPDLNVSIWITVFGVVIIFFNLFRVRVMGEAEFWLSLIKVITLTVLIITCFTISMGGNPKHDRIGFRYWSNPGAFAQYLLPGKTGHFLGWWATMCQACFAYTGTEVVGMTFGEVPNPRKLIPHTVRQTFLRIICFYILGVLVLGMCVPYDNDRLVGATRAGTSAAASPFVVAITLADISVFPDIINAALLAFVLSAAMTDIYVASRCVYGLAKDRQAPRLLAKALDNGNPIMAVILSSCFVLVGYLNSSKSAASVFQYFVSLVTVFAVLNWIAILVSFLSFRRALKAQGIQVKELPYVGLLQPYGSYYALVISFAILFFNGYDAFIPHFKARTFVLKYLGIVLFGGNFAFWKLFRRTRWIRAADVDLVTDRQEFSDVAPAGETEA